MTSHGGAEVSRTLATQMFKPEETTNNNEQTVKKKHRHSVLKED
jgi:hypothetical protein